jgi:hypothetical protein
MNDAHNLISEMLRHGVLFARDKLFSKGTHKHFHANIADYQTYFKADQLSMEECYSLSKEIYGVAKTYEQKHPELTGRYPEFFRILDGICKHVHQETGSFAYTVDGKALAYVEA